MTSRQEHTKQQTQIDQCDTTIRSHINRLNQEKPKSILSKIHQKRTKVRSRKAKGHKKIGKSDERFSLKIQFLYFKMD